MRKRPFRCFRYIKNKPYPKSKYCRKCPQSKITYYDMGNKNAKVDKYACCIQLINLERRNISSSTLETLRIKLKRGLERTIGKKNYHFKIKVHPLHIVRINKMLTKAGADRIQSGMRKAFGKPISLCGRLKNNQEILVVRSRFKNRNKILKIVKQLTYKISGPQLVQLSKNWGYTNIPINKYINHSRSDNLKKIGTNAKIFKKALINKKFLNWLQKIKHFSN